MTPDPDAVTLPRAAAAALYRLFEVMWAEVGFCDPGHELISDGVRLTQIASLVESADAHLIDEAIEAVEPHVSAIRNALQPTPQPTTCRHCGRTSHGFVCWEQLQASGCEQP